jgi:2-oxo-4-hydroxy-4-carboxy--5-ureidoimidazoline (OHCU) decarboxylase
MTSNVGSEPSFGTAAMWQPDAGLIRNSARGGAITRPMKKASEYREHARECRALAATMDSAQQREQLLQMAEHWEKLAEDRVALIRAHPELAHTGEHDEERSWRSNAS